MKQGTWASDKPKLWGQVKPGLNFYLAPKAGSSLLAHCAYLRLHGKEYKREPDHMVHVKLEEESKSGIIRADKLTGGWFCQREKLSMPGEIGYMVWRNPVKRIESAIRMFMDDSTDMAFKKMWWKEWGFGKPFSVESMRFIMLRGIRGVRAEKHFMPYARLPYGPLMPERLILLEKLEAFLVEQKIRLPEKTVRNEASENAKGIDMTPFKDLLEEIGVMDSLFFAQYVRNKRVL